MFMTPPADRDQDCKQPIDDQAGDRLRRRQSDHGHGNGDPGQGGRTPGIPLGCQQDRCRAEQHRGEQP
jgi:hypothetical protein